MQIVAEVVLHNGRLPRLNLLSESLQAQRSGSLSMSEVESGVPESSRVGFNRNGRRAPES